MESTSEFASRVIRHVKELSLNENELENQLAYFLDDIFKLIKNIDQTSLNSLDRSQRLIEAEKKYGIPKTHLIIK